MKPMTDTAPAATHEPLIQIGAERGRVQVATVEELTHLAASAKAKVRASALGWSILSKHEILALAWFADLFLEDGALPAPTAAKPAPPVISTL
jgi:hypothetical protein